MDASTEHIEHNGTLLAIIVRNNFFAHTTQFLTTDDMAMQLGYMNHLAGHKVVPHLHLPVIRKTMGTQEVLFIKSGNI